MVTKFTPEEIFLDPAEGETVIAENVSFEDFLKYFGEKRAEWLMGKVITVLSNNAQHNRILGLLYMILRLFLGFKPIGEVLLAGLPMYISTDTPSREPDLLFVLTKHADRVKATYLDGAADLVVEIVSPESIERDRAKKLREYEVAGIAEYWLIDPMRTEWVIYVLGGDDHYHPRPADSEGRLTSSVLPGFALQPALLWQEVPPNSPALIDMAREMAESGS